MAFSLRFREHFRRRWVRGVALTLLWLAVVVAIGAANGCLFYFSANQLISIEGAITGTWLLLMFIFVARRWGRVAIGVAAVAVFLTVQGCVLAIGPVVNTALFLVSEARSVRATAGGPSHNIFPGAFKLESDSPFGRNVYRSYQLRYIAFGEDVQGKKTHFRIEATRRCSYCRVLTSLTIMDDGTIYSTPENRPATAADTVFSKAPL
jgi:hypothetical protein